jgi:hypothetical protein
MFQAERDERRVFIVRSTIQHVLIARRRSESFVVRYRGEVTPFRPLPQTSMPFAAPAGLSKLHGLAIGYVAFAGLFAMLGLTFVVIALVLVGTSTKTGRRSQCA